MDASYECLIGRLYMAHTSGVLNLLSQLTLTATLHGKGSSTHLRRPHTASERKVTPSK